MLHRQNSKFDKTFFKDTGNRFRWKKKKIDVNKQVVYSS